MSKVVANSARILASSSHPVARVCGKHRFDRKIFARKIKENARKIKENAPTTL